MRVEFTVDDRPPKKHGEKSLWAREDEASHVAMLREKALEARSKAGMKDCFRTMVAIELMVFVPSFQLESVGDLDSFVTGVCDSLQAANPKVIPYLCGLFLKTIGTELDPRNPVLIDDDSKVMSIIASKMTSSGTSQVGYKIVVEPIQVR